MIENVLTKANENEFRNAVMAVFAYEPLIKLEGLNK